ncbi:hypothetical protein [Streptomyces pulveraceus]|uniref:Uncharacterized protein n=1 Tax=Streptomyces pulveraceus TaxID=68258 RepID=A0ABW1GSY6_9ACTN
MSEAFAAEGTVSGPVFALVDTRLTDPPDNASVMRHTSDAAPSGPRAPSGPQSSRLPFSGTENASGRRNRTVKKSRGRTVQVTVPALDQEQGASVRVPVTVAAGVSGSAALTATYRAKRRAGVRRHDGDRGSVTGPGLREAPCVPRPARVRR